MNRKIYKIEETVKITEFYTMFERICPSGFSFSGETHNFWECVYVKSGIVHVTADERVYTLKEGDIIFHKPLEMHKLHVNKNESSVLFIFTFSLSGTIADFFENKVFALTKKQQAIMKSLFLFIDEKVADMQEPCEKDALMLEAISRSSTHMLILTNYIQKLFLSICDSFNVTSETDTESTRIFKTAVKIMNENMHLSLSVKDIAGKCCISETGLKKIFSQLTGLGVHKYFLKLKLNRASTLLSEGNSVSDTSDMLGFSSQAYFSAAFKRETGALPGKIKIQKKN